MNTKQAAIAYQKLLERLTPDTVSEMAGFIHPDVRFCDPFVDVRGHGEMIAVFKHMFARLHPVRFAVRRLVHGDRTCFMSWTFSARLLGRPWEVEGVSEVTFDADGRVTEHVDYWDAAMAFYARLPIIGQPLKWLRRRVGTRS